MHTASDTALGFLVLRLQVGKCQAEPLRYSAYNQSETESGCFSTLTSF